MKIVVLCPWTDPNGDFVKTYHGMLENEVDMTDVEVVAIDEMPEGVLHRDDMPPAAAGLENLPLSTPGVASSFRIYFKRWSTGLLKVEAI